ncbi:2Fe-2S iron-sulfur cluster binding domain-containing protein [bacterium]|nr:2Fe-2S iron-sulfur cluster binding domain-containing protein [bacterium]RQV98302.1 MAG: oxidoreductase [bacterium]
MISNILLTVALLCGINGLLALFLIIAERFFLNYGPCTITVNESKTVRVPGGSSLLSTLNNEKIFLPSACGGRGTCGTCKCRITQGAGPLLPTEMPLLTQKEIADQIRLACQVKVKRDLSIRIPEALFSIKEFKAQVTLIKDLTYDIKLIRFKILGDDEILFKPGQYVQLQSVSYDDVKESVSRAYSIASSSDEKKSIDLMIRLVPEGICTTWVHQYLSEGDEVRFTGPMGDFCLCEGTGEIIMVAGGSGMAPIVSFLRYLIQTKSKRKVTYFFGAVTKKDLFYLDEMKRFEKEMVDFTFIPALSQPEPDDQWDGETGLITVPMKKYIQQIDTETCQAYLCGSPGMIKACVQILNENGVTSDRIFYDPFA